MIELILVRHGETDANARGVYCGWTDAPLNERGRTQAKRAGTLLKDEKIDAFYVSPLKRTLETAQWIVGDDRIEVLTSEQIKEQHFGLWENLCYQEIEKSFPKECKAWNEDWMHFCVPQGESLMQVEKRAVAFIDTLLQENQKGKVLIVTHLGVIRLLLVHLLEMQSVDFWRFRVDNGRVTRIVINDEGYAYLTGLNV